MMFESARIAEQNDKEDFSRLHKMSRVEIQEHKGADLWQKTTALSANSELLFSEIIDHQEFVFIIGAYDNCPCGFMIAQWVSIYDNMSLDIKEVFVDSEMRSVGVGEAMMDLLINTAEKSSAVSIVSRALPGDRQLKNFFERYKVTARVITVERKL